MLKIRLMRIGAKKRPFYRVVVVDERTKRTGAYLELLGTYNPLTKPHEIKLKQDRIDHWIKQGAQPSDGFLRMTGKAKLRPPRKPKKATGDRVQATAEKVEEKAEKQPAEEKVEEVKEEIGNEEAEKEQEEKEVKESEDK